MLKRYFRFYSTVFCCCCSRCRPVARTVRGSSIVFDPQMFAPALAAPAETAAVTNLASNSSTWLKNTTGGGPALAV